MINSKHEIIQQKNIGIDRTLQISLLRVKEKQLI